MLRGRREQGKSILRMLTRSLPGILEFPYRLGRLYFQEGNTRLALREFETILKKDPLDFEAIKLALACYRDLNDFIGEGRLIQSVLKKGDRGFRGWMLARLAGWPGPDSDLIFSDGFDSGNTTNWTLTVP